MKKIRFAKSLTQQLINVQNLQHVLFDNTIDTTGRNIRTDREYPDHMEKGDDHIGINA